jgi:flagellar basal body-associated protein FliL
MSRDDFDFDNDPFGDDNDVDDLRFDANDDLGGFGADDDFDFDIDQGADEFSDLDEIDEDFLVTGDGGEETGGGTNRTFVILAVVMILLFLGGLAAVIFISLQDDAPSPVDLTITARVEQNATTFALATETANAGTVIAEEAAVTGTVLAQLNETQQAGLTVTAEANNATATASANELVANQTASAEAEIANQTATQEALSAQGTQTALGPLQEPATPTPEGPSVTDTPAGPPPTSGSLSAEDVQATATALVMALFPSLPQESPTPGTGGQATPPPDFGGGTTNGGLEMPQTGLLDGASGEGMGLIVLAAAGLVGVIFGARRLRAMNNRK